MKLLPAAIATALRLALAPTLVSVGLAACDDDGDGGGGTTGETSEPTSTAGPSTSAGDDGDMPTTGTTAHMADDTSGDGSSSEGASSSGEGASSSSSGGESSESGSESSSGGETSELCFEGGSRAPAVTGAGTCADPYLVDLSGQAHGTIVTHSASGGGDEMDMGGGCDIPPTGTARDIVYHVMMPLDVMELHVSVDSSDGADPRIAVAEDPSCFQPMNACADELGAGACEGVIAPRNGFGFFGTSTYVVVNEFVDSGAELTVRFFTAG